MEMHKINEEITKLPLKEPDKQAILKLIDIKTNDDMEKVLNKMDAINHSLKASIDTISNSLKANTEATNSKIEATNSKIDSVKWFIAIAITIVGVLIALKEYFR